MSVKILGGDVLDKLAGLPDCSVHTCITSPPYWGLRDYGVAGQIGLEKTPEEYIAKMVQVFQAVKRVLRDDGTLFLNLGDSYWGGKGENGSSKARATAEERGYTQSGGTVQMSKRPSDGKYETLKPKDLCGIPWRVALALQAAGWYLRSDIIWYKRNPMPESVTDRPTKSHEYIFLLTKSQRYYYDAEAVKEKSITNNLRRPYGSQGSWDIDGRPEEQRHGGEPRSFKGSKFNTGKTAIHQLNRSSDLPRVSGNLPGRDDGGRACNKPGQETRNLRSVWDITTKGYPGAHFATFPPELPERCIKAGTSEKGVCSECGAGWVRVVEKSGGISGESMFNHTDEHIKGKRTKGTTRKAKGTDGSYKTNTTGWLPGCKCNAETKPAIVLDPFGGSGTVGEVAERLGRDCILIELNPKYIPLIEKRCHHTNMFSTGDK